MTVLFSCVLTNPAHGLLPSLVLSPHLPAFLPSSPCISFFTLKQVMTCVAPADAELVHVASGLTS